jgi:putative intracellular protease/amidase
MKAFWICLLAGIAVGVAAPPDRVSANATKRFVCAPCGSPCDGKLYERPGTCPTCGMALVAEDAAAAMAHPQRRAAILLFDGIEIIDYTGPYEVFGASDFDVYTVAERKQPVTTAMGMTVVPKYSFADAPQANVVVVPGGAVQGARSSKPTLEWIRAQAARADHTMSVCNGAFILGSAGLLDGLSATTTAHLIGRLRAEFPKTKVVDDQRFVDNGKIMTTAGLSAGIDGALHVVARVSGVGVAQAAALGLEYDWRPHKGFARAALADMLIPDLGLDRLGHWETVRTEGDADRWELVVRGTSDRNLAQMMDQINRELASRGKWTRTGGSATSSRWKLSGRGGEPWKATLSLEAAKNVYTAKLNLERIDVHQ